MRRLPLHVTARIFVATVCLGLALPTPASAQSRESRRASTKAQSRAEGTMRVQYKGVQLERVIRDIGEATGTRFIYGDDIRGVVTIAVPKPVSHDLALELLRAALFLKGYAQVPAPADSFRIVPIAATPTDSEFLRGPLEAGSEKAITTIVEVKHISAEQVVETIKSLAPSSGTIFAHVESNSIVFSGTEAALRRLISIIRLLDAAASESLFTRVIRHRDVVELIEMADMALNAGWSQSNQIEFHSDVRTNMLLARASEARLDALRDFIDQFDRLETGSGGLHVVRVRNRDANEVIGIIQSLQSGGASDGRRQRDARGGDGDGPASLLTQDLPTSETASSLEGLEFSLTADERSRSIIIQAARSEAQIVADMIEELDRIPPRVAIEIFYYEIQRPSEFVLSFDVTGTFAPSDSAAFRVSSTPTGPAGTPDPGTSSGMFARAGNPPIIGVVENPITGESIEAFSLPTNEVVVNASATGTTAALLSRPFLTVLSGEEHEIFVGNNVPIPVASGASAGTAADGTPIQANPLVQTQTIERHDVGVRVRFKPTVGEAGNVSLELTFQLDQVVASIVGASAEAVGVTTAQRVIESKIVLRPGQYVLLGMAEQKSTAYAKTGVPWLMNIPGFGLLFSRLEERSIDTRLMVAARARLLRTPADDVAESIRRRIAFERSISRVNDLEKVPERPWAVRLATFEYRDDARAVADSFEGDGYVARVTKWEGEGRAYWDVYLIGYADYETAAIVALQATEADWDGEVLLVPSINEMAPED